MKINLNTEFLNVTQDIRKSYMDTVEEYLDSYYKLKLPYYKEYETNIDWNNFLNVSQKWNDMIVLKSMKANMNVQYFGTKKLQELLRSKTINYETQRIKLHSSINSREGKVLARIIKHNSIRNSLEIGMAYGISSMYILLAMYSYNDDKNINLTSIDPYQEKQWKNLGLFNIKTINMDKYHTLYEDVSEIILPTLFKKNHKYDLIFIDGWHTFDNTLIDVYYAVRLVNIGGFIVIDDIKHQGVNKVIRYIDVNYNKHLKRINSYDINTMAIYKKVFEDKRSWNFHKNF